MNILEKEIDKELFIKILIIIIAVCIIYLALTLSTILFIKNYELGETTDVVTLPEKNAFEDVPDGEFSIHIDKLESEGKCIEISGWAFKQGDELATFNSYFVLKNKETGKMYRMKTNCEENINLRQEHNMAGIHARCFKFGIPSGMYDIYVLYQNDGNECLVDSLIPVQI